MEKTKSGLYVPDGTNQSYTANGNSAEQTHKYEKGNVINNIIKPAAMYSAIQATKESYWISMKIGSALDRLYEENGINDPEKMNGSIPDFAEKMKEKLYSLFFERIKNYGFEINKDKLGIIETKTAIETFTKMFIGYDISKLNQAALKGETNFFQVLREEERNAPAAVLGNSFQMYVNNFFPNKKDLTEALSAATGMKYDEPSEGINAVYMDLRTALYSLPDLSIAENNYRRQLEENGININGRVIVFGDEKSLLERIIEGKEIPFTPLEEEKEEEKSTLEEEVKAA